MTSIYLHACLLDGNHLNITLNGTGLKTFSYLIRLDCGEYLMAPTILTDNFVQFTIKARLLYMNALEIYIDGTDRKYIDGSKGFNISVVCIDTKNKKQYISGDIQFSIPTDNLDIWTTCSSALFNVILCGNTSDDIKENLLEIEKWAMDGKDYYGDDPNLCLDLAKVCTLLFKKKITI